MTAGAITADPLGFVVAFGAGILSFLSPCVLPLVPGYLSLVTGFEAVELEAGAGPGGRAEAGAGAGPGGRAEAGAGPGGRAEAGAGAGPGGRAEAGAGPGGRAEAGAGAGARPPLAPLLRGILAFVAGFTVVFVALGATASGLGHLLGAHKQLLAVVSGAVVITLGAVLLLGALPAGAWTRLGSGPAGAVARVVGERRFSVRPSALGAWAAPVMGMAFAFAWTPCLGPVLGAITALATTRSTVAGGAGLLFAYSLGIGVPFVATGLAFGRLTGLFARARRGLGAVHLGAGVVLVAFGVLLVMGRLSWLTDEMQVVMRHLGLGRFAVS